MHLTRGEKMALCLLLPMVIGLLPPVTGWAAAVQTTAFGLPFLLFWNALMVVGASLLLGLAVILKRRVDRQ